MNLPPRFHGSQTSAARSANSMPLPIADVIWPGLVLEQRLFSSWAIGFGLVVELFFLKCVTSLKLDRCIVANLAMNAVSAGLGLLLIPLFGLMFDFTTSGWI